MKGRRFWMVYHPHGAIVDGAGAKVVLADSESEETLGESFSSSKRQFCSRYRRFHSFLYRSFLARGIAIA